MFGACRPKLSGMQRQSASHCAFAKLGPHSGEYAPGPSKVGEVASSTVTVYFRLMFVNASSVGCGGGMARIVYFVELGLDSAISLCHLEDSLF